MTTAAKLCYGAIFGLTGAAIVVLSAATFGSVVPGLLLVAFITAIVGLMFKATG
jgi:hypothetical protein